ncbi:MAG: exodeoxyribonuclease VII large subunit [Oscillospiraceae bacterium]|nr:exodeoxyribonuclease VII large subunit [Oscillospiraceae bacterium]
MDNELRILSVSQISQHIKGLMDRDELLSGVLIRGEISNYKMYPSGHHYFTLKDADSALRCVMFRGDAVRLRFRPENGMQVIAAGRISVFPRDGQYQLYCVSLTPEGAGQLQIAFEQLKNKLQAQGLFDPAEKKPLPMYPKQIALVTSPVGAAVRDMLRILKARWPMSRVLVVPVRVQGEQAAEEIAAAIDYLNYYKLGDLLITGRGGGSVEDLWAFNEEPVAQAIFNSEIPVISAVGHEPDVTISDFVADLRAATPSNAAELAVPDRTEVEKRLNHLSQRLWRAATQPISAARQRLERLKRSRVLTDPAAGIREKRLLLDYQSGNLLHGMEQVLGSQQRRMGRLAAALDALSPLKVLGRGYAIARDESGRVLTGAEQVETGDKLDVRLADGSLTCRVEERKCL